MSAANVKARNGFTFFRSFRDAVEMTGEEEQLVLYKAIADYALDGVEPDISTFGALGRLCWTALRPNLEAGVVRFRNGCNGGAPKGNQNARKTTKKQPRNDLKTTNPLLNENENVDENVKGVVGGSDDKRRNGTKRKTFVPPSPQELKAYFSILGGTGQDADRFFDHFTANGWLVSGKSPMKNWQAAARNWMRGNRSWQNNEKTTMNHESKPKYQAL